ncbi:MAG: hypothetical protein IKZ87_05945 [Actinomycetaceae bacterium]|nr:hypothetical protein [Actinomycetaceae bacterium]
MLRLFSFSVIFLAILLTGIAIDALFSAGAVLSGIATGLCGALAVRGMMLIALPR